LLRRLMSGQGCDAIQIRCDLREQMNTAAFEAAWQRLLDRHAVLRTSLGTEEAGQGTRQHVHDGIKIDVEQLDWRDLPGAQRGAKLGEVLKTECQRGFDWSNPPLAHLVLIRMDEAEYRFIFTASQLVLDECAALVLIEEFFVLYDAIKEGRRVELKPVRPFEDYVQWLQEQDWSKAKDFWQQTLKGLSAPTPLPPGFLTGSEPAAEDKHGEQEIHIAQVVSSTLRLVQQTNDLALSTLMQGAWALLLGRYTGEEDIVFGELRDCRASSIEEAESMVGPLANPIPVRVGISPEKPLLTWLKELEQQSRALRAFEHTPPETVQASSELPPEGPAFESILSVRERSWDAQLWDHNGHCTSRRIDIRRRWPFPIAVEVFGGTTLAIRISYDRRRFDDGTITRMLGHFRTVLDEIAAHPLRPLSTVPILTLPERHQMLVEWNDTRRDFPDERCIHQLVAEQVRRTPEATALIFKDRTLTYRELDAQANELAERLRVLNVGPDVLVGLCVERSLEMVVGLLAILKAGGAYVPLDPAYPKERLDFMLEDAQVAALVTTDPLGRNFALPQSRIVYLDRAQRPDASNSNTIGESNRPLPTANPQSSHLAYVIYTSGSTGKPKGVMVTHRNVVNFFAGMDELLGADAGVWLAATSISFDISVLELLWTLTRGFKVIVQADEDKFRSEEPRRQKQRSNAIGYSIPEQIARHEVTHFQCTPSLAGMLAQDSKALVALRSLRKFLLGGEALPTSLVEQLALPGEIINMYGPTETTVWSATHRVAPGENPIPIGRPIANTELFILDRHLEPAPVGVAGELFIGGAGVVRGYLNRPELTAERFIAHPFSSEPGARLYRTGDQARYRPDGRIEYLGRLDHQVKVRGFRVELGEIEAALRQHPDIREGVAIVKEFNPGDQRVVACLVARNGHHVETGELRRLLKAKLPDFMVPSSFVWLDKLPLTPNGKVDRKALLRANGLSSSGDMPATVAHGDGDRVGDNLPVPDPINPTLRKEMPPVPQSTNPAPLSQDERHKILVEWNETRTDYPRERCLHTLFEAQAKKTPNAAAVVHGEREMTYGELNGRANQLACYLRKLGVGPEMWVGLCMDRSFELVIGLLGILKAGGAYLPLDWQYPQERLRFMLEDAQARFLVTQEQFMKQLPQHSARMVCLDAAAQEIKRESTADLENVADPGSLAYVMYTSGSTGRAKGAAIEHRSVNAFVHWARDVFTAQELAGVLASTSICFDLSVFELFVPLSWGGTVIMAENALELPRLPARERVTLLNTVPSAIRDLLKTGGVPASARTVNLAGEALPTRLVQQLYALPSIQKVYDLYGPSETTTYSTFVLRSAQGPETVGRPIANTQVYLLDEHMQPVPLGAEGELFIGGEGLARGYLNRPELTAERFIPNPFRNEPGARLYRTGDLARYLPDGQIQFLGRADHQVKIRGYRIELREIEVVLANHPAVSECAAVAREDHPGEKMIAAYFVLEPEKSLSVLDLRHYLRQTLPDYMIPSSLARLEALPRTPNGKIDRRALPAPDQLGVTDAKELMAASDSPVEQALAKIWCEVIGLPTVGRHDNFFDLGGHSVLVTQILARIRKTFCVELSLQSIFEAPTIAELAEVVEEALVAEIEELSEDEAQQRLDGRELVAKEGQLK